MKKCSKCKTHKDLNEFKKHIYHKDGLYSWCNKCVSEYRKRPEIMEQSRLSRNEWRRKNPDKSKLFAKKFRESESGKKAIFDWQLRTNYGITSDQYNEMFNNQNGCCAICNTHQSKLSRRLSVDHDHETGEVRELLCNFCNTSLGNFKEDIDLIKKAIAYLEKHKKGILI